MKTLISAAALFIIMSLSTHSVAQEQPTADNHTPHLESPYSSENMLGFSGIDLGLRYGRYNVIPRDPYTGTSYLGLGSHESPTKPLQKVTMYSLSFLLYGSVLGHMLLKKRDRKLVIADISELGLDLGRATESGKQLDGSDIHSLVGKAGPNNTLGAFVNAATGILVAYRINNYMRASLRYQYLIDQGVIFESWIGLDHTRNFDLSRKSLTGTLSYRKYLVEANIGMGWKYGDSPHGNKGWGLGIKKHVGGDNKHIGLKMDFVYQRKSPEFGTRNWHSIMFFYGVGV